MKILIQLPNYWPEVGGSENYVRYLSREFLKKGHQVSIVCQNNSKLNENDEFEGANIYRFKTPKIPRGLKWSWPYWHLNVLKKFYSKNFKPDEFDLIICRFPPFVSASLSYFKSNVVYIPPSVYSKVNKIIGNKVPLNRKIAKNLTGFVLNRFERKNLAKARVAPLSKLVLRQLEGFGLNECKIIRPGIDLERFRPGRNRVNNVVFLGRMSYEKNPSSAIRAFKELSNKEAKLIFIGKRTHEKEKSILESVREDKRKKIKFLGEKLHPEKYLSESKIFLLPSLYESFGHVLLEAAASGTPVIAFRPDGKKVITASDEIIKEDVTGFLVKDEKEMAEKIDLLLGDEKLWAKMSKAARKEAEKYSWEKTANEILKFAKN